MNLRFIKGIRIRHWVLVKIQDSSSESNRSVNEVLLKIQASSMESESNSKDSRLINGLESVSGFQYSRFFNGIRISQWSTCSDPRFIKGIGIRLWYKIKNQIHQWIQSESSIEYFQRFKIHQWNWNLSIGYFKRFKIHQ
ncbi:hypothetical protein L1887_11033 [Cichorium endivia]|nr:hypothetical protein L1887_11033 [Cichorium endivia]